MICAAEYVKQISVAAKAMAQITHLNDLSDELLQLKKVMFTCFAPCAVVISIILH